MSSVRSSKRRYPSRTPRDRLPRRRVPPSLVLDSWAAFQRDRDAHARSLVRRALQVQLPAQRLDAFPQAYQPQPLPARGRVETLPIVLTNETDFARADARQGYCHLGRLRMLGDVGQAFLCEPVQGDIHLFAQVIQFALRCETATYRRMPSPPLLDAVFDCGPQPQFVERNRAQAPHQAA